MKNIFKKIGVIGAIVGGLSAAGYLGYSLFVKDNFVVSKGDYKFEITVYDRHSNVPGSFSFDLGVWKEKFSFASSEGEEQLCKYFVNIFSLEGHTGKVDYLQILDADCNKEAEKIALKRYDGGNYSDDEILLEIDGKLGEKIASEESPDYALRKEMNLMYANFWEEHDVDDLIEEVTKINTIKRDPLVDKVNKALGGVEKLP